MPIETSTRDNGTGVIIDISGVVTDEELIDALVRQFNGPEESRQHTSLLLDFSAVTKMNLTEETTAAIAQLCAKAAGADPDLLVAVVAYFSMAASIDLLNRIAGLYELFQHRSGWESHVFRTRPEAVRWLRRRTAEKTGSPDP